MNYAEKVVFYLRKHPEKWFTAKNLCNEVGMSMPTWSILKHEMINKKYIKSVVKSNHAYYKADIKLIVTEIEEIFNDFEGVWVK